ncbi:MAG: DUF5131 family protein, partial [Terriglobia bacterium]
PASLQIPNSSAYSTSPRTRSYQPGTTLSPPICEVIFARALSLNGIRWAIVGGESGARARPFDIAWARSILRQCREQQVACFVKQLGRRPVSDQSPLKLRSCKGGEWAEWPTDLRVRQYPSL